ncbi:carbohydrate porin [Pseudomonas sp. 65/3-MNA-CIBAN-0223]
MVRPNIQYLANPGGVYEVDDATVVGALHSAILQ